MYHIGAHEHIFTHTHTFMVLITTTYINQSPRLGSIPGAQTPHRLHFLHLRLLLKRLEQHLVLVSDSEIDKDVYRYTYICQSLENIRKSTYQWDC